MKRSLLLVAGLLAAMLVPVVGLAAPASAHCAPPDGQNYVWTISKKSFAYYPTNVHSDWVIFRKGGSINYSQTRTMEVNASMSSTVSAEAGVVFGKVSASVGFSVGKSLSDSRTWSYTANVPADTKHKYRLHAYHYTVSFTVAKKRFDIATCNYKTVSHWPQRVTHAPAKGSRNVWRLDKAAA
jgi:hypothetical protein